MKLVYENKLSCENDVKDFVLEGSAEIYFENGKMRMKNALSADWDKSQTLCIGATRTFRQMCR